MWQTALGPAQPREPVRTYVRGNVSVSSSVRARPLPSARMDRGAPISYVLLAERTPVFTAEETEVGKVKRVLADFDHDLFDGLVLDTPDGDRFVDASRVADVHERAVVLSLSSGEAAHLPEPTPAPAEMEVDPADTAKRSPAEEVGRTVRRVWDRISGNY